MQYAEIAACTNMQLLHATNCNNLHADVCGCGCMLRSATCSMQQCAAACSNMYPHKARSNMKHVRCMLLHIAECSILHATTFRMQKHKACSSMQSYAVARSFQQHAACSSMLHASVCSMQQLFIAVCCILLHAAY